MGVCMILVIGGAFQGKQNMRKSLAAERAEGDDSSRIFTKIREMAEHGDDREEAGIWAEELARDHPKDILILEEVGYGIVPWKRKTGCFGKWWERLVRF